MTTAQAQEVVVQIPDDIKPKFDMKMGMNTLKHLVHQHTHIF